MLEQLFGPAPHGVSPNERALRSDDGVLLRFSADADDDRLTLMSSPGRLPAAHVAPATWHHTLNHGGFEHMRCSLLSMPATDPPWQRLCLLDVWCRHGLQAHRLQAWLDDHARRHRVWLHLLAEGGHQGIARPNEGFAARSAMAAAHDLSGRFV